MKILVTGGGGYIGSVLVPELLNIGHEVTVVDNFMYEENSLALCCGNQKFDLHNKDIRDTAFLKGLLPKFDVIIPLASLVGAPLCARDPVGATTINHDAQMWLIKNSSKEQSIIMPTTNSGYGAAGDKDICTEETPLAPISLYGKHKVEVEEALMSREHSTSFRLATVFGMSARMRMDLLVNDFTYRAFADKAVVLFESHFKRNFIHVRDVARLFLFALENAKAIDGKVFNAGLSDANLSKLELCHAIKKYVPGFVFLEAPIGNDPDQRNYIVSNERLEKTGFRTEWSLDRGIQELLKGFRSLQTRRYTNV